MTLTRPGDVTDAAHRAVTRLAVPALRLSLGLVYVWFGVLKVIGQSPVADLVRASTPFVHDPWVVVALGWVEVLLGLALLVGKPRRAAPALVAAHLVGTFLVFVETPDLAVHDGNALLLTTTGEFVLKNVVLICAALTLIALGDARTRTVD